MTSKNYCVRIPTSGYIEFEVKADSEDEAIASAWERYHSTETPHDKHTWEALERVVSGNVFWGMQSRVEVEELD